MPSPPCDSWDLLATIDVARIERWADLALDAVSLAAVFADD